MKASAKRTHTHNAHFHKSFNVVVKRREGWKHAQHIYAFVPLAFCTASTRPLISTQFRSALFIFRICISTERTNMRRRPIDFSSERRIRILHTTPIYSQRWNFSMETLFRVRPWCACTNDDRRNLHAITRGVITKFITQNQQRNLCSLSDDATRLVYAPLAQIFMIAPSPPETLITRCFSRCIHLLRFPPRGTQIKCEKSAVFCVLFNQLNGFELDGRSCFVFAIFLLHRGVRL